MRSAGGSVAVSFPPLEPLAWSNWRAFRMGLPELGVFEFGLYSDAWPLSEVITGLGPMQILNPVAGGRHEEARMAIVVRMGFTGRCRPSGVRGLSRDTSVTWRSTREKKLHRCSRLPSVSAVGRVASFESFDHAKTCVAGPLALTIGQSNCRSLGGSTDPSYQPCPQQLLGGVQCICRTLLRFLSVTRT
jgi:hypothetical protein